jgi:hypothetical protein
VTERELGSFIFENGSILPFTNLHNPDVCSRFCRGGRAGARSARLSELKNGKPASKSANQPRLAPLALLLALLMALLKQRERRTPSNQSAPLGILHWWCVGDPPLNTVGNGRLYFHFAHRTVKSPFGDGRLFLLPDLAPPNVPRGTLGSPKSPSRAVAVG